MTSSVKIISGACGFVTKVRIKRGKKNEPYSVEIESDCEHVQSMAEDINRLDRMDAFVRFMENPVYRAADRHLKHVSCPVPFGILAALEAEAGFRLPKDARIEFVGVTPDRRMKR